jgi:exodeoxyribonuclease VII large subunit
MPERVAHIGVITSATGAAVKDILSVLNRRFPAIQVSIFPTAVQGDQAARQIVDALTWANQHGQCDALIVGRGGGSLEDLWPFNEEAVARAIFASDIPVVSAVGHEVDFTIADFVADLRAPTPSAAAELLSPDGEDMLNQFEGFELLLAEAAMRKIRQLEQRTDYLQKRLQHPGRKLQEQAQHLDHLDIRLRRAMAGKMQQQRSQAQSLQDRLHRQDPSAAIAQRKQAIAASVKQMIRAVSQQLEAKQNQTNQAMHLLDTVSPLKTLGRGYSIIRNDQNAVVRSISQVKAGDQLRGQLVDGELVLAVTGSSDKKL